MAGEDSMWGMVVHYPYRDLMDILKQGGVGWIRTQVHFNQQTGPTAPPQYGDAPAMVNLANRAPTQQVYLGIDPNYPEWISQGKPFLPGAPASDNWLHRFTHWQTFVQKVVRDFGPMGVSYFSIGNEPNDPGFFRYGLNDYLNLLMIAVIEIQAAGHKACAPDIATGSHDPWGFLRACLQWLSQRGKHLDVVSVHGYCTRDGGVNNLMNQLAQVNDVQRACGVNIPVWLTETGISNFNFPGNPDEDAKRVKQICQWIGVGPAPPGFPIFHPQQKFLRKVFFYVWSDDREDGGKYAWLARPFPSGSLAPIERLWEAYTSAIEGN